MHAMMKIGRSGSISLKIVRFSKKNTARSYFLSADEERACEAVFKFMLYFPWIRVSL